MDITPAKIDEYCAAHSSPPSALLDELQAYTNRNCANAGMVVGSLEAAFLRLLVRVSDARHILEIGTFTGYSAIAMADAMPADGRLITCDIDPTHAEIAQCFFARSTVGHKIQLRLGPALETLAQLPADPPFDLAFLDADKENYLNYFNAVVPRLKRGGLIVADNVLWSGAVLKPKEETDRALVAFNDFVRADPRVECVVLPLRDGVSVIRKI
jgi:caffeoyl-CoA O-methyltransferase